MATVNLSDLVDAYRTLHKLPAGEEVKVEQDLDPFDHQWHCSVTYGEGDTPVFRLARRDGMYYDVRMIDQTAGTKRYVAPKIWEEPGAGYDFERFGLSNAGRATGAIIYDARANIVVRASRSAALSKGWEFRLSDDGLLTVGEWSGFPHFVYDSNAPRIVGAVMVCTPDRPKEVRYSELGKLPYERMFPLFPQH
jgi:hypothetical protein